VMQDAQSAASAIGNIRLKLVSDITSELTRRREFTLRSPEQS